jgi:asparagine synthase (glutamine-hydrolysing)
MCGIAGIIGKITGRNRGALARMGRAMRHRGPDGEHAWESTPDANGDGVLLVHRRLSILDLSTCADQPMTDPVGGQTIVFNGEIYNYAILREELLRGGQSFASTGDTAVMLRALALQGDESVERLRGMFAFALFDPATRRLTLARDPHGIKPLYVCFSRDVEGNGEWSVAFASEVRALLASGLIPSPRVDPAAVASVVWNGFVTGPNTIVRGVSSVWPGEVVTLDRGGEVVGRRTYWSIPEAKPRSGLGLAGAIGESVKLHLCSDVPLGVFLSGGVDSGSVANHARRAGNDVDTFTLAFKEQEFNEGEFAKSIAAAVGTRHHEIVLTEPAFVADLDAACDCLDQPSFDGINSYYMSKAVRDAGMKVALVGTGGDELFGGYRSFREVPRLVKLARRTRMAPAALKVLGARLVARFLAGAGGPVAPQTRWAKLPDMIAAGEDVLALYQMAYALFLPTFQRELLADGIDPLPLGLPLALEERLRRESRSDSVLRSISVLEQRLFLGERLLRDSDAASMAVSIETRLPLVDATLTGAAAGIGDEARYWPVGRKQALRDAGLIGLDPQLFERPKSGFVIPFDRWIRAGLGASMDELMNDAPAARAAGLNPAAVGRLWAAYRAGGPGLYWSRVWSMYALMRYCRVHGLSV